MKFHIDENLSLPTEAVVQTFAILAKKGAGKSYLASVMAEEMLEHNNQVVVIDPTGGWFGLRSSSDGKHPGFPIVVMGGDHADLPLEEAAGEVVASAIVENGFSAIIDLSLFRKGQLNRFMGLFAEALYRLNREPLHLFVDEADAVAPQKPFGEEARTLGAMEDIVRRRCRPSRRSAPPWLRRSAAPAINRRFRDVRICRARRHDRYLHHARLPLPATRN